MRKLAAALDANPMSLYHHVPEGSLAAWRGENGRRPVPHRDTGGRSLQERMRLLATDFRTLAHRHPNLMAYSFSQRPDFIQPEDPFWVALTAVLDAAGVPQSDVPQLAALGVRRRHRRDDRRRRRAPPVVEPPARHTRLRRGRPRRRGLWRGPDVPPGAGHDHQRHGRSAHRPITPMRATAGPRRTPARLRRISVSSDHRPHAAEGSRRESRSRTWRPAST